MKTILILLALFFAVTVEASTTRYVDVSLGSNCGGNYDYAARDCSAGSDGDAYRMVNINAAIAASACGDTIRIRGGTYTTPISDVSITWPACSAVSTLTIMAETSETVTFAAAAQTMINITKPATAYTTFQRTNLTCSGAFSVCVGVSGNNLRFENITATGSNSSTSTSGVIYLINSTGHHNAFIGGRAHSPGQDTVGGFFSPWGYQFYVTGDDNLVEHMEIDSNEGYAIHNYCSGEGCSPDRNTYRYNKIHDVCTSTPNTCAGILLGSGLSNVAVSNVIYNIGQGGASEGAGIQISNGSSGSIAYNNTISTARVGLAYYNQSSPGYFINNIIYNVGATYWDGLQAQSITRSHNLCPPGSGAQITGCSVLTATPGFTNAGSHDYSLASGSPAIDAGVSSIAPLPAPLNGTFTALANGSLPDIGAFETVPFASASCTTTSACDITFGAAYAPLSTIASCTGVTVTQGGGAPLTCTGFSNNGNATYRWTCTACLSAGGGTIAITIAVSKFTDGINIGGSYQGNHVLTTQTMANNIAGTSEVFTVMAFRPRTWGRAVTDTVAAGWLRGENTAGSVRNDIGKFSNWWLIGCTIADCPSVGFQFEQNLNGGAWAAVTDSCLTNPLCFDSTNSAAPHGTVIQTCMLTNPLGSCLAGAVAAQANSYPVLDLTINQATAIQGNFAIKSGLVAGTDVICVRPKLDSGTAMTHSQTACYNVVVPSGAAS